MIKETVTYMDYDGKTATKDLHFNITKVEAIKLQIQFEGGLEGHMKKLTETENAIQAFSLFEDIVVNAYGKKLPNGEFVKVDVETGVPLKYTFQNSAECSEFIIGLVQHADKGAEFMRNCLPPDVIQAAKEAEEAEKAKKDQEAQEGTPELDASAPVLEASNDVAVPVAPEEPKEPTDEELLKMDAKDMTQAQLVRAYKLKVTSTPSSE